MGVYTKEYADMVTERMTILDKVFHAIPIEQPIDLKTLAESLPDVKRQQIHGSLNALRKEESVLLVNQDKREGASTYQRLSEKREKNEYWKKRTTSWKRKSKPESVLAEAIQKAKAQQVGWEPPKQADKDSQGALTTCAEAFMEFQKSVGVLEGRVTAVLKVARELEAERDKYKAIVQELSGIINGMKPHGKRRKTDQG